jgi:hypothetical protein
MHCQLPFTTKEVVVPELPKRAPRSPEATQRIVEAQREILKIVMPPTAIEPPEMPNPYLGQG